MSTVPTPTGTPISIGKPDAKEDWGEVEFGGDEGFIDVEDPCVSEPGATGRPLVVEVEPDVKDVADLDPEVVADSLETLLVAV